MKISAQWRMPLIAMIACGAMITWHYAGHYLEERRINAYWAAHMNEELSTSQLAMIPAMTRQYHITDVEAARRINAEYIHRNPGPSEEERRVEFNRQKRDADIAAIHIALCNRQPYLDRCQ